MAVYEKTNEPAFTLMERHIYGSSRLGMDVTLVDMLGTNGTPAPTNISNLLGKRQYEISNHLGNVQAVVLDFKIPVDDGSNGTVNDGIADYYIANIVNAQDYYPFGMIMPNRDFSIAGYRYGFNGKENDDEVKGAGNSLDFGARIYDSRLGRWLTLDPLAFKMPTHSPYNYALNNPLIIIDEGGKYPKPSEILTDLGFEPSPMIAGLMDGFVSGLGWLDAAEFAYDLATDPEFREQLWESFKTIASDPVAFAKHVANSYVEKGKAILSGSDEGQYALGEMIGELAGGVVSGGAAIKLVKLAKDFKVSKLAQKAKIAKACGCFTSGTLVLTSIGFKNIEDIVIGDSVWAYSDSLHILQLRPVIKVYNKEFTQYYELYFSNQKLEVTHEHPFFISGKWKTADSLIVGDTLTTFNGSIQTIDSIKFASGKSVTVYNFTVEGFHTYYVSNLNILVHNGDPCPVKLLDPNGKTIRNSKYAGSVHPETKVPFDKNGYPDFSKHLYKGGKNDV